MSWAHTPPTQKPTFDLHLTQDDKFLRITGFEQVQSPGLDGHRYELSIELGELIKGTFVPNESRTIPITTSATLQAVWGLSDSQVAESSASAAIVAVTNVASGGSLAGAGPINLNTYTAPKIAPPFLKVAPGTVVPVPQKPAVAPAITRLTFLSDDIAEVRDHINAVAKVLLGARLLELPQERAILDVYRPATTAEEFRSRIQSLAIICVSMNKDALGRALSKANTDEIGSITLLREYLTNIAHPGQADSICDVLKHINNLRKGYPAHGDNASEYLRAHDFFRIRYPVSEYALVWDTVIGRYFQTLKKLRDLLTDYRQSRRE